MARARLRIDPRVRRRRRLRNRLQTLLLVLGMTALLSACGWLVAGIEGLLLALLFGSLGLLSLNSVSPAVVLRLFGARPMPHEGLEPLHRLVAVLAQRAGLERPPALYLVLSPLMNAFSVGRAGASAVVVTSGLLQRLTLRELAGVLAHEVSHIQHDDMWVMGLADIISRMTRSLAMLGILLLLFNLPILAGGGTPLPWTLILLLVIAPGLGTLLQLALARTREYAPTWRPRP